MRRLVLIFLLFPFLAPAQTRLQFSAHWDDGSHVIGTVMLAHGATTDHSQAFTGSASLYNFSVQPNVLYTVTLSTVNPLTQQPATFIMTFFVPSVLLDPSKISSASCRLELSRTTGAPVQGGTQISVSF